MAAVEIYYPNASDAGARNSEAQLNRLLNRCTGPGGLVVKLSFELYTNLQAHSAYPYVLQDNLAASLECTANDARDESRLEYLQTCRAGIDTGSRRLRFHAVSTRGSDSALPPLSHPVQKTLNLLFASGNIAVGGEEICLVPPSIWRASSMDGLPCEIHTFYREDRFLGALGLHYGGNFTVRGRTFYGPRHQRAAQADLVTQKLIEMTESNTGERPYAIPAIQPPEALAVAMGKRATAYQLPIPCSFEELLPPALQ